MFRCAMVLIALVLPASVRGQGVWLDCEEGAGGRRAFAPSSSAYQYGGYAPRPFSSGRAYGAGPYYGGGSMPFSSSAYGSCNGSSYAGATFAAPRGYSGSSTGYYADMGMSAPLVYESREPYYAPPPRSYPGYGPQGYAAPSYRPEVEYIEAPRGVVLIRRAPPRYYIDGP